MKRICKHAVIPVSLLENQDLTMAEKFVLVSLDTFCASEDGVNIGYVALATSCGITAKEAKDIMKSLQTKGAVRVSIGERGEPLFIPLMYKERYIPDGTPVVGNSPKDIVAIPYDEIQEQWNAICSGLPRLERMTTRRKTKIRTCLKNADATVSDLIKVFRLAASSDFLSGKSCSWNATFDWVIMPDNFQKVIEGNYHKGFAEQKVYKAIMEGNDTPSQSRPEDDLYR